MLKMKRSFLLLLVLFLAACGTQTQLPEAPQITDDGLGQISATELEAAFEATGVSAQSGYDKHKYNKFTLKKVVEGYGPEHQKYKLAIICKVPYKEHKLAVVAAAHLKGGEYKHFLVPKKYVKCAAFEFEYFGDEVKFKVEQKKHHQYSGVEYYGKLKVKVWGKKLDFKASKFFHLKPGDAKFIVINKYKKVEAPKKLELIIKKKFESEYKHDDYGKVKVQLICKDYASEEFYLGDHEEKKLELHYDYKDCYLKEAYYNDHYTLKHVSFDFDYYDDKYDTSKDGNVEGNYAKSPKFELKTYYKKLVIVITNKVEKKPKKFELVVKKVFKKEYNDKEEVYPDDYELDIKLVCDGGITIDIGKDTHYESDYYDLRGKNCEVKEKFYDDKYQTVQYSVSYDADYGEDKVTYNDCYTKKDDHDKDYDYCEYSRYYVDKDAHKLIIIIIDRVQHRYHPPYPHS